jgi:endonuclease YncB( thermonuclease family)
MLWSWPGSTITRVIDGDSLTARLTRDIGFHGIVTFEQRLRLWGINTPPVKSVQGAAATALVTELVTGAAVGIDTVKPYKYGDEWMAVITLPDGRDVATALIDAGLAVAWDGRGPRPGG